MNLIEKQGNTELYYQGETYGTIYAKYNGKTIRLVGASYAQAKTGELVSGYIPLAAEVDKERNHIVMPWRYLDFEENWLPSKEGITMPVDLENVQELFRGLVEILSLAESKAILESEFKEILDEIYLT